MRPATHKPRLPKNLSFPIGFEAISGALVSVPFSDEIRLEFTDGSSYWRASINARIDAEDPYSIVTASHEKWDKRLGVEYAGSLHKGVWSMTIYPVRRDLKSVAKAALIHTGLPFVAKWFSAERSESWYWGKKELHLVFLPREKNLEIREDVVRL